MHLSIARDVSPGRFFLRGRESKRPAMGNDRPFEGGTILSRRADGGGDCAGPLDLYGEGEGLIQGVSVQGVLIHVLGGCFSLFFFTQRAAPALGEKAL